MSAEDVVRRCDYRPYPFAIDDVDLSVVIDEDETRVATELACRRNPAAEGAPDLELAGRNLELRRIALDGRALAPDAYVTDARGLRVRGVPDSFTLSTEVAIRPQDNAALEGLYRSGRMFCTQCEPEGFRRITYHADRPDVMSRIRTRIEADRTRYPVLLANGNRIAAGETAEGRHWVQWEDPHPKPTYLFALVAGDLVSVTGDRTTVSGRPVRIEFWVEPGSEDRCEHALASLVEAMAWDERRFGLAYDLDLYMVVAVGDFNMGAMENKGLNIFNAKYVLAKHETATDDDFEQIAGIIAHEYFHNWTGNRVTCRDWFQLTLKEGLTVFRDQSFSADVGSAAVKRVRDVRMLRGRQFPEDAGPLRHPIRPESYREINNFYTATVYEKGAEVVRMYRTLLGADGFRRGLDLYFERHDGQAVTCDDFRAAMADANHRDLTGLGRWYEQAGTPVVAVSGAYGADAATYVLTCEQRNPHEPGLPPLTIPLAVGLLGSDGRELLPEGTRVLEFGERRQDFVFTGVPEEPVPSLLRGFSAPVRVEREQSADELAFLAAHDSDPFNRWDAYQALARRALLSEVPGVDEERLAAAFGAVLADPEIDGSFASLLLALPALRELEQAVEPVDPDRLHAAREGLAGRLAATWRDRLAAVYERCRPRTGRDPAARDARRLKNACLGYLCRLEEEETWDLAAAQYRAAGNMTDASAAMTCLVSAANPHRDAVLADFHHRWRDDPLVLDKWFAVQARSPAPDTTERVIALAGHPDFSLRNPNRVRSLIGAFSAGNPVRFHAPDGRGYAFLARTVRRLDADNPQVAARLATGFEQWRRYEPGRRALMRRELAALADAGLSRDVSEIVGRALGEEGPGSSSGAEG